MKEQTNYRYEPLQNEEVQKLWTKHKNIIESFITNNGYNTENILINQNAVLAIIAKVDQRRQYFEFYHGLNMSEYKEVALISFWCIKLHPICLKSEHINSQNSNEYELINEELALFYIIITLKSMLKTKNFSVSRIDNLPREYFNEITYSFRYRDISKEALILLVESIAIFLDLNPYITK